MPAKNITLVVDFTAKLHDISADNTTEIQLSTNKASARETVTISLNDTAVQAGKKISSVTVTAQQGEYGNQYDVTAVKGADGTWSFTIPVAVGNSGDVFNDPNGVSLESNPFTFHVAAVVAEKAINVTVGNISYGTATLLSSKADAGETVTFTLRANADGYKVRTGSVKLSLTSAMSAVVSTVDILATQNPDGT